ncbi:MAG: hypothetical protein GYA51_01060 [Candidatus Methanofastidiosa archaeon]|nr:hypothetical protein [Candidatus Methanofastidiosa archaeon]
MTVFILPVGMIIIGMKIGKLTEPVRILTFDKPYYKADRRSRTGFLPDRTAQVINVEEVENPGRKMLAAYIILGVVSMLTIIGIIIALVA